DQPAARKCGDFMKQPVHFDLGQDYGQQAVLAAVAEKYVGVGRRDQGAKAVLGERPGRVLARAAAAEVLARKQYARALVAWLVEHEIGVERAACVGLVRPALVKIAPGVEQVRPEPRA